MHRKYDQQIIVLDFFFYSYLTFCSKLILQPHAEAHSSQRKFKCCISKLLYNLLNHRLWNELINEFFFFFNVDRFRQMNGWNFNLFTILKYTLK